jgi:hypothetical protein
MHHLTTCTSYLIEGNGIEGIERTAGRGMAQWGLQGHTLITLVWPQEAIAIEVD